MKNKMQNQKGFTLIELILVIAILGILAVAVAPQVGNIMANSQTRSRDGTVGMIQSAINNSFSNALSQNGVGQYPAALDGVANGTQCDANGATCFGGVLQQPVVSADWTKTNATTYTHNPTSTNVVYTPATGVFAVQ